MSDERVEIARRAAAGASERLEAMQRARAAFLGPIRERLAAIRTGVRYGLDRADILDDLDDVIFELEKDLPPKDYYLPAGAWENKKPG